MMKKYLLIILCIAPLAMIAQKQKSVVKANTTYIGGSKAYGQLQVTTTTNGTTIKVDFGSSLKEMCEDKDLLLEIETISSTRFRNLPDALNTISSLGWEVEMSYFTETRTGGYNTFIFSKDGAPLNNANLTNAKGAPAKVAKGKR